MFRKLKNLWLKVIHQDATPHDIALGFAIGLFSTFYPLPVVDTLVALAIAKLVRANLPACLIGNTFIMVIFPVIPLLLAAEVFVGRLIIAAPKLIPPGDTPVFTWLRAQTGPNLAALGLGGLILGIPAALMAYWVVRKAANGLLKDVHRETEISGPLE
jgi:uncharacterized protein (DUF2062 family)